MIYSQSDKASSGSLEGRKIAMFLVPPRASD